ncbi:MAG: efflux RND transporter periplasmic adaptor subunit [Planctomycetota bacterium]
MKRFFGYFFLLILGGGAGIGVTYFAVPEVRQYWITKIDQFKLKQIEENEIDRGLDNQKLIQVLKLVPQNIELKEEFTGFLKPSREAFLSPKTQGILESIFYKEGQEVPAEKILAQIESDSLKLEKKLKQQELLIAQKNYQKLLKGSRKEDVDRLKSKLKELEVQIENVSWNLEKIKKLYQDGVVPEKQIQDTDANYRMLQQLLEQTRSSLTMAEKGNWDEDVETAHIQCELVQVALELIDKRIEDTCLKAPFLGYLAEVSAEIGEYATPPKILFHLIEMDPIIMEIGVPEYLLSRLHEQQLVDIKLNAFSEQPFSGEISRLPLITQANSRLFPVEIKIQNPEKKLKPGMLGTASITFKSLLSQYVFSLNYSIPKETKKIIYLESGGVCKRVELENCLIYQGQIIVSPELLASPQLIISGALDLSDGDRVQIVASQE